MLRARFRSISLVAGEERSRRTGRGAVAVAALIAAAVGCSDPASPQSAQPSDEEREPPPPPPSAIAFVSNRDGSHSIYVSEADGSNVRRLARGFRPAWSWDGQRLAFDANNRIHVMNADGSDVRPIAEEGRWPAWSPDDRTIAFYDQGSGERPSGLYVMNADGSGAELLRSDQWAIDSTGIFWAYGSATLQAPTWSPDGERIAFWVGWDGGPWVAFIMNGDGTDPQRLSQDCCWNYDPAWAPDGSRIAATEIDRSGVHSIVTHDMASRDREVLFRSPVAYAEHGDWSPDGRHIVFSGLADGRRRIFLLTLETGQVRQLIPDAEGPALAGYRDMAPVWSRVIKE